MTRHTILSKPHWQQDAASPVLLSMPLQELEALDSLIEFMTAHECSTLDISDCRAWARMNGGAPILQEAVAAMIKTDGEDTPLLAALRAAESELSACSTFGGIPRETTRVYVRSISLADGDLPKEWQAQLEHIRNRIFDGQVIKAQLGFNSPAQLDCW